MPFCVIPGNSCKPNYCCVLLLHIFFQVLVSHEGTVSCVAIADHYQFVISGSHDNTLIIWNLQAGSVKHVLHGHNSHVTCVKLTKDGSIAISGKLLARIFIESKTFF